MKNESDIEKVKVQFVENEEDYAHCMAIRKSVFIEEQNVPKELEIEHEEEAHHFLAFYEGLPVATGRYRLKKGFVKFERIATLKDFRGKGIARTLMQQMHEDCLEKYSEYLPAMHAQASAVPFYINLGWIPLGELFQEANIDHQLMIFPPKNPSKLRCLLDPSTPKPILDYLHQKLKIKT